MNAVKWIKYVFFLFLGIGLMYLAFKNQSPKALIAQLKDVNYLWVVISMFFGFIAIILAAINILGGFLVTQRMLQMYKKKKDKKK